MTDLKVVALVPPAAQSAKTTAPAQETANRHRVLRLTNPIVVAVILVVQALCAFFFVSDILMTYFGMETTPIKWQYRELLEIGASIGLVLGLVLGGFAITYSIRRAMHVENKLREMSGAFMDLMQQRFTAWGLTPAERDVALFAIKGLSTQEIAALRNTSEGTVKAQTNAIYRKADVSGRPQLLSLFIEDLMGDDLPVPGQVKDAVRPVNTAN